MRALVLTPEFPPTRGGIAALVHGTVSHLRRVETRVVTIGSPEAVPLERDVAGDVVRVGRRAATHNKLAVAGLNAAGLWQAARFRPAAVLSGHAVTAPANALLSGIGRAPTVQYVHANEFRNRPALTRFAMGRAAAVIAVSSYARELAVAAGCEPEKVHVVHPGVDQPPPTGVARGERPTVLTVARMHDPYKGHDTIIRSLPAVRERVPEVEWVVIGEGRLRPSLERLAAECGVADSVRFLGAVSDAERDRWFAQAHVFAMPSRLPPGGIGGEGFGIVYLEAASRGLPVVAAAAGGALDAVAHGETGVLVEPDDERGLADAIATLLLDPLRAEQLGAAGARRAREFTWQRHSDAVEALLLEVGRG